MPRSSIVCPQCELEIDLGHAPRAILDSDGKLAAPHLLAIRCERCVAWIRIEGWTAWSPTHYSMTPFRDSTAALAAFPEGTWFAVADVAVGN